MTSERMWTEEEVTAILAEWWGTAARSGQWLLDAFVVGGGVLVRVSAVLTFLRGHLAPPHAPFPPPEAIATMTRILNGGPLEQSTRAGAREATGEPNGQAFEAAARVLRGEPVAPRAHAEAKVWTRDDMADAFELIRGSVTTMSKAIVLLGFDREAADRARAAYLGAKGNGPEVRKGLPFFADEADAMLAVLNGEAKPEPPRPLGLASRLAEPKPLGIVLSESTGHRLVIHVVGRRGVTEGRRIALAQPGRDALLMRLVVGSSGRGWWSAMPSRPGFSGASSGRVETMSLDAFLPGDMGRVRLDRFEVYDLAEVEAYARATSPPDVPEWARTAEKKEGEAKALRYTSAEVTLSRAGESAVVVPAGTTVTYERDVMVVSDKAPEPDHEKRAREAAAERREALFKGVPALTRNQAIDLRQLGIFAPPPWPAPETDDPYKAPRIATIDAASNGGQQNLPPSRTLAEALSRARERRALALGGVRHLTTFVAIIDAATATAEATPHAVLCCELCGAAENDAVAELGAMSTLTKMVRLPDGRLACEACARKAGAP